jgi:hypothetical protein
MKSLNSGGLLLFVFIGSREGGLGSNELFELSHIFVPDPCQDLDFQCQSFIVVFFMFNDVFTNKIVKRLMARYVYQKPV